MDATTTTTTTSKPDQRDNESTDKDVCPTCKTPLKPKTFRTGSLSRPKENVRVCERCGTRY